MGFRTGAYARIWEIEPKGDTLTRGRISVSVKNKQTGAYDQDFSGYVMFIGTACAKNASKLNEKDVIKIGDCDVSTKYDKEKRTSYTNFKIFSFEEADNARPATKKQVDDGEAEAFDEEDAQLPF